MDDEKRMNKESLISFIMIREVIPKNHIFL
jgi:hypothetical protein